VPSKSWSLKPSPLRISGITIRQTLTAPPTLNYPRQTNTSVLTTDASDTGIGAVVTTVIEYANRALTEAKRRYVTIEKKCLATFWAVNKFHHYLIGGHFILEADHKPLEWLQSSHISLNPSQQLERWSSELGAYEFNVVYRLGKTNQNADTLSKKPITLVALNHSMETADLAEAQQQDLVLSRVF